MFVGPILDDRLKEKILKPWKGALSSHSVCLSVCLCVCLCVSLYIDYLKNISTYFDEIWHDDV